MSEITRGTLVFAAVVGLCVSPSLAQERLAAAPARRDVREPFALFASRCGWCG